MALPKHRGSKTRKAKRRTHQKATMPNVIECPHCKAPMLSHRACKSCGYYAGRSVVALKVS
ncbi:MAG: 50S ribosomal protein L32 [Chloroflexi bacterium]|nr:50S ribosomal protein L32 [bacterium]RLC83354.1 MAG: 50S ribosomal protein L32 [Chloroflexota bacterium]